MALRSKSLSPLDERVCGLLRASAESQGLPYRAIAQASGLTLNRIGIVFRAETPGPTIGEIAALCDALGEDIVDIVRQAETPVKPMARTTDSPLSERREFATLRGHGRAETC